MTALATFKADLAAYVAASGGGGGGYTSGPWTPADASGAGLTFSNVSAYYVQTAGMVFAFFYLSYPANSSSAAIKIGGLPATVSNNNYSLKPEFIDIHYAGANPMFFARPNKNDTSFVIINNGTGANPTNAGLNGITISGCLMYPV